MASCALTSGSINSLWLLSPTSMRMDLMVTQFLPNGDLLFNSIGGPTRVKLASGN
jgi:hypothetical protein